MLSYAMLRRLADLGDFAATLRMELAIYFETLVTA
jgi:hypothetical protein